MRTRFVIVSIVLALGCNATDSPGIGVNCTDEARPALSVTPFDSKTGDAVKSLGIATVTEGSFTQSVPNQPPGAPGFYLAYERAGTYDVVVKVPGYQDWKITGAVVKRDACHVITVPLAASLVK
jgi:hypothetical protein